MTYKLGAPSIRATPCSIHDEAESNLPNIAVHFVKALPVFSHVQANERGAVDTIPEVVGGIVTENGLQSQPAKR